jgi:hypothetical protein
MQYPSWAPIAVASRSRTHVKLDIDGELRRLSADKALAPGEWGSRPRHEAAVSASRSTAEDFERIGIKRDQVAPQGEAAGADGSAETYRWWTSTHP